MSVPAEITCTAANRQLALRDAINALKAELSARQRDPRPLPSSVFRAYQAKLDNYYAELSEYERPPISSI